MSDLWHDPLFLAALGKRSKGGSASGDIVSFDAPRAAPLRSLLVNIDPVQAGTGDPSPYNVRPITGWTGTNVQIAGKNLIKGPFPEYTNYNGTTWRNNADGSVSVTGTPTESAYCRVLISLPAGTYIVSGAPNESAIGHNDILIQNINFVTIARDYKNATAETKTFTLDALSQINVALRGGLNYPTNCTFYPMIQLASSAGSTYTPYSGTTIPITWQSEAGTVYGGPLDVLTGKLRATHGLSVQPLAQRYVTSVQTQTGGDTTFWIYAGAEFLVYDTWEDAICNIAKVNAPATIPSQLQRNEFGLSATYRSSYYMRLATDLVGTTISSVYDYLSTHKVEMWLKLDTPIEYTLTPQQIISSLAGENNLWADTGDVTVEWAGGKGFGKETMLAAILHGKNQ